MKLNVIIPPILKGIVDNRVLIYIIVNYSCFESEIMILDIYTTYRSSGFGVNRYWKILNSMHLSINRIMPVGLKAYKTPWDIF